MGRVLYVDEWLAAPADRVGLLDAATVRLLREGEFTDYGCEWVAAQTSNQPLQQTAGADRFQGLHRPKKPSFAWFRYQNKPGTPCYDPFSYPFHHSNHSNIDSSGQMKWFWRGVHTSARHIATEQNDELQSRIAYFFP